jgi:AbrB family looped-hinge helix DNA binding protein
MSGSKLTTKFQATIPKDIRKQLKLSAGDVIVFQVVGDTVIIKKGKSFDKEHLKALQKTLSEWNSSFDDEAYEHLQNL